LAFKTNKVGEKQKVCLQWDVSQREMNWTSAWR